MELLDRYLQAVKKHLPWKRQDDIIAELRVNLEAQLEDKEAELGRPLTKAEAEEWLKQIGPPLQVAARYQPQRYLIGPAVFPIYWYVMRLAILWCLAICAIVNAVLIATQNPSGDAVLEAVLRIPGILITTAAWVTAIFVAVEFFVNQHPEKFPPLAAFAPSWSPASLPPLEADLPPGTKPRSFSHAVAEVVFGFLFLVWLLLIPHYPFLLLGPGVVILRVSPLQLAPVWIQFYWWVVGLNILQLASHGSDLVRGTWRLPQPLQHIVFKAFALIPLGILVAVHDQAYVSLKRPTLLSELHGASLQAINQGIYKAVLIIVAISVLQIGWDVIRAITDATHRRAAAMK